MKTIVLNFIYIALFQRNVPQGFANKSSKYNFNSNKAASKSPLPGDVSPMQSHILLKGQMNKKGKVTKGFKGQ